MDQSSGQSLSDSVEPACSKCARAVDLGDCWIVRQTSASDQARYAAFCRLEHIVPWVMRGASWPSYIVAGMVLSGEAPTSCAFCGSEIDQSSTDAVDLARPHAGELAWRSFCDTEHLRAWASAGGPWARR